jgi:peroxiredoxin
MLYALTVILAAAYLRAWWQAAKTTPFVRLVPVNHLAPDATVIAADTSQPVRLSEWRGQTIYLEFASLECGISLAELPALAEWAQTHPDVKVLVVAQDAPEALRAYTASNSAVRFLSDPDGRAFSAYGIYGTPTSYVIAPGGAVRYVRAGGPDTATNFDAQLSLRP